MGTSLREQLAAAKQAGFAISELVLTSGNQAIAGVKTFSSALKTTAGIGASPIGTVVAAEYGDGITHKTVLTCTALALSIADDAGVAQFGGVKIYDFPEGLLKFDGAVIDGAVTLGTTGTIINTYDGYVALGSVTATTGATLVSTEADYLTATALTQAVAKVAVCDAISIATALTESGSRWMDGTATAKDMYLNFAIADDGTHTAGTGTFTGTISLMWSILGDK